MPTFDIVSEMNEVELRNAVENAAREVESRFDFRGVTATIEQKELTVTLCSESDFQVRQLEDLLIKHCAKRNIDCNFAEIDEKPVHSGKLFSLNYTFKQGIDQPTAKEIVKLIKESKLKVQASIQGDQIRVNGKKRDDLQEVIAFLKNSSVTLPLQFQNFRD